MMIQARVTITFCDDIALFTKKEDYTTFIMMKEKLICCVQYSSELLVCGIVGF